MCETRDLHVKENLYRALVSKYGKILQLIVAVEELNELQSDICEMILNEVNPNKVLWDSTTIDVKAMLQQMYDRAKCNQSQCKILRQVHFKDKELNPSENFFEECADVEIVLEQIKNMFRELSAKELISYHKSRKLIRTQTKLINSGEV